MAASTAQAGPSPSSTIPSPPPSPPPGTGPGSGRGLSRLKLRKPLFLASSTKKSKDRAISCPLNEQFNPIDVPPSLDGPRSPAKAWRLLGIPSSESSPGRTPTNKSPPAKSAARSSSSTCLRSRPSLGPPPRMSFEDDEEVVPINTRPGLLRSVSAHPLRPRRHLVSTATPPIPPRSVPLAFTPQLGITADDSGEQMPQASLRSALFKASLEASGLSHLGSSAGTTPAISRTPSSEHLQVWPPVNLASRFSDATSTAAHSTASLVSAAETDSPKYTDGLDEYEEDTMVDQLQCTQYRNDLRTPHPNPRQLPLDPDDVATAMAALRARTPRRSLSLPSLVRSNSDGSLASSYDAFQSPREFERVLSAARSRQGSGSTADGGMGYDDLAGGWREENGRIEEERYGLGLGFEWVRPPVGVGERME